MLVARARVGACGLAMGASSSAFMIAFIRALNATPLEEVG